MLFRFHTQLDPSPTIYLIQMDRATLSHVLKENGIKTVVTVIGTNKSLNIVDQLLTLDTDVLVLFAQDNIISARYGVTQEMIRTYCFGTSDTPTKEEWIYYILICDKIGLVQGRGIWDLPTMDLS